MTIEDLKEIVARDEGETIEFKETTGQRGDACESLCAFLNRDGGAVVFGVSRKGKLTGQLVSDNTKRDLFEVFQKFEPAADVEVDWVPIDETEYGNVLTVFQRPGWARTGTMAEITGTTNPRTGTKPVITGMRWVVLVSDPVAHLPNLRKDARANAEVVLHEIIADNTATIPEICARTGMALRTINNAIATLREAGIVQSGDFKTGLKEGVKSRANGEDDGVNDGVNEGVSEGVNEGVNALYEIIVRQPGCRANALAKSAGKSVQTVERYLKVLKDLGKIEFRGAPKTGGYYVR